jgi:5-methylcytosine-specific restriction endonuclease McrA
LIKEIRNKSQREVEAVVARHRPQALPRDRVRPVCVRVPVEANESSTPDGSHSRSGSGNTANTRAERTAKPGPPVESNAPEIRLEQRLMVQFSAGEEFMHKFKEVRSLLSHRLPCGASFADVFEAVIDEFLNRHSPRRRMERRDNSLKNNNLRQPRDPIPSSSDHCGDHTKTPRKNGENRRSRYIPVAVRDQVFTRDGGRCVYVGPSGKRCGATHNLTLDHITPFARGGTNAVDNLRLLCAKHNLLEAERIYGVDLVKQYRRRE